MKPHIGDHATGVAFICCSKKWESSGIVLMILMCYRLKVGAGLKCGVPYCHLRRSRFWWWRVASQWFTRSFCLFSRPTWEDNPNQNITCRLSLGRGWTHQPGSNEVELANLIFMADRPPHEGDFTIESDRPVIFYVMGKALRAKLRTLRQQRAWDLYRFTLARYELLLGLPPRERDLTSFMQDFNFESLESAKSIRGIGPLECAVLSSHVAMIPVLAHAGYDLTRVVHAQINIQTLQEGHSSLAFALELSWRTPEVASQLVKFRANPNVTDTFGLLPLGFCRTPEAVEMLVQHRADVNKSAGPLHLPPLSNCCIRCAPAGVVAKLLEYQAEIDTQKAALRGVGAAQPLSALGVFSSVNPHALEVAQLPLDAKASIDSQCPGRGVFRLLELLSRARIRVAPCAGSRLVRFFAECSATPLGIACYFGGHEYVDFLLQAEADPNIKNNRGNTAFQLAHGENVLKVIDQFETISIWAGHKGLTLFHWFY